jgi:glutathione S-transferase
MRGEPTSEAILTINSTNYGAWSLRGWLLCKFAGLRFRVEMVSCDDPDHRADPLLLSPPTLVPRLHHDDVDVWDTLAIAEYLHELFPESSLLPADPAARVKCRAVCGEVHSGFANLRAALPMNMKAQHRDFPISGPAKADIDRIESIWDECLAASGGPFLFGDIRTVADAMYAPVCVRLRTYDVKVGVVASSYVETILGMLEMGEWMTTAQREPDDVAG